MSKFKKPIRVACSPLTGTIYAGTLLKNGQTWSADKQEVTIDALVAVAQHALMHQRRTGDPVVISADGKPEYWITVQDLTLADKSSDQEADHDDQ